jgi:hypothetical protein
MTILLHFSGADREHCTEPPVHAGAKMGSTFDSLATTNLPHTLFVLSFVSCLPPVALRTMFGHVIDTPDGISPLLLSPNSDGRQFGVAVSTRSFL